MPSIKNILRRINANSCVFFARLVNRFRSSIPNKPAVHHPAEFVLLISRPQDIELLMDIYQEGRQRDDINVCFWITKRAVDRFPAILKRLLELNISPEYTLSHAKLFQAIGHLRRVDGLLTTVESTLAAHKIPYKLTQLANAIGVHTYTMQHGFENVGLTCRPETRFLAHTVLTWGGIENLSADISSETRRKCVPVGCPKIHLSIPPVPVLQDNTPLIIAVFESLHAERFNDDYVSQFFRDLQAMVKYFPKLRFILKLHPGGLMRSPLCIKLLNSLTGLEVLDPTNPETACWTTQKLLTYAITTITTPSTIALDAALAGKPVAVLRYRETYAYYGYYEPLPLLDQAEDWLKFLEKSTNNSEGFQPGKTAFLNKVILPGDAANRILDLVVDKSRKRTADEK